MSPDNNDSIFVFTKVVNIDKQEVGDKLSIDDINKQFSQSVDNVTIEDTEVEALEILLSENCEKQVRGF